MTSSIKFGIQIEPQFGFKYDTIKEIALQGEELGFTSLWSSDHFFYGSNPEVTDCLEAWTLISALAVDTSKIRLGTLVTGNNYRYPPLLAKMAATVDQVSNGRLDFGIGAGWKQNEYEAYGIPFPSVKDRMDQLEESIQIIKRLWNEPKVTFQGKHYQLKDAYSSPKPIQNPMPFFIGGSGKKRIMKMVAEYGDYLNLPFTKMSELKSIFKALQGHCDNIGRDFNEIGKSYFTMVFVANSDEELELEIQRRAKIFNRPVEEIRKQVKSSEYPGSFIGYSDEIKERIGFLYDEFNFDYFHLMFPYPRDLEISKRFGEQVLTKY